MRLLIANRGEIARRIIRTARAQGWHTIAVHTDLDSAALHVRDADESLWVPSYLDIDAVVAAAAQARATHVHPGYGFLSERSEFARALASAGIALVGPSADVMDAMGRKDAAREVATGAGVPVVPSYSDASSIPTDAYPVLIKAAAGGGGKGMRVVRAPQEYDDARAAAAREAAHAFGDDTLLIEKYVESGRHIEVQVIGDEHGQVVHLGERDCSAQRRHQKVLEEAPAPTLDAETRERICAAGAALASAVGYTNAGTVEFLLDNATGEFYFLEMNTRLQVEHPVTEMVMRVCDEPVDLVALQLQVATGQPLGFTQSEVTCVGHAIEARVYAEDAFGGFLPQAGTATLVRWPASARIDHALESGQLVSTSYDPMLGKVICAGLTRADAIAAVLRALDDTVVMGLTTNTGFLRALVGSEEFNSNLIDTSWLDKHSLPAPHDEHARMLAAVALRDDLAQVGGPWQPDGFRLSAPTADLLSLPDSPGLAVEGRFGECDVREVHSRREGDVRFVDLEIGREGGVERRRGVVRRSRLLTEVIERGQRFVFTRPDPFRETSTAGGDGRVVSPMPGTVLDVKVETGERVEAGDTLGVVEAMKMELALKAPQAGVVSAVLVKPGQQVSLGQLLFEVSND